MSEEAPARTAGKWVILLAAWGIGLAVFALYLAGIAYLIFKWFG